MPPVGTVWSCRSHVSALISAYRQHPLLWNVKHKDHKDRILTDKAYQIILAQMQQYMPGLSLSLMKNKIHTLHSQLNKEWKLVWDSMRDCPADSHYPSLARHHSVWTGNGYWGDIALVGNVSRGNMSPVYCGYNTD